jgi:hypothetical protein
MLDFICKGLQSVMISGDVLRFNHQSFVDFLTDPTVCPKEFLIDIITQNETLALASFQAMAGLQFNICGLETSHVRNDQILDLDERVKTTISTHLRYSCLFWADHLQAAAFSLELLHEVKVFMRTRLLHWLEVLSLVKEVRVAAGILKVVVDWCDVSFVSCLHILRSRLK